MDPTETLNNLLELVAKLRGYEDSGEEPDEPGEYYNIATEMAAGIEALNGWLLQGNFLPGPWADAFLARVKDIAGRRGEVVNGRYTPVSRPGTHVQPDGLPQGVDRRRNDL